MVNAFVGHGNRCHELGDIVSGAAREWLSAEAGAAHGMLEERLGGSEASVYPCAELAVVRLSGWAGIEALAHRPDVPVLALPVRVSVGQRSVLRDLLNQVDVGEHLDRQVLE